MKAMKNKKNKKNKSQKAQQSFTERIAKAAGGFKERAKSMNSEEKAEQALEFFNLLHGSSKFRGRNDLFSCGHSTKTSLLVLLAPEK